MSKPTLDKLQEEIEAFHFEHDLMKRMIVELTASGETKLSETKRSDKELTVLLRIFADCAPGMFDWKREFLTRTDGVVIEAIRELPFIKRGEMTGLDELVLKFPDDLSHMWKLPHLEKMILSRFAKILTMPMTRHSAINFDIDEIESILKMIRERQFTHDFPRAIVEGRNALQRLKRALVVLDEFDEYDRQNPEPLWREDPPLEAEPRSGSLSRKVHDR